MLQAASRIGRRLRRVLGCRIGLAVEGDECIIHLPTYRYIVHCFVTVGLPPEIKTERNGNYTKIILCRSQLSLFNKWLKNIN